MAGWQIQQHVWLCDNVCGRHIITKVSNKNSTTALRVFFVCVFKMAPMCAASHLLPVVCFPGCFIVYGFFVPDVYWSKTPVSLRDSNKELYVSSRPNSYSLTVCLPLKPNWKLNVYKLFNLNIKKTEIVVFGPVLPAFWPLLSPFCKLHIRNLGVLFDSRQTNNLSHLFLLTDLVRVKAFLSFSIFDKLIHVFILISSLLDYCNALYMKIAWRWKAPDGGTPTVHICLWLNVWHIFTDG